MSRDLQKRGLAESVYERPNREWVCGWASLGKACPRGPAPDGRCVVTHECAPLRRGDRWECTRPSTHGGVCAAGPLPGGTCCRPIERCQPVRSLRSQRGRVARWSAAVTVALVAIGVSGTNGRQFVSPGPIGVQHGPIEDDCASCHSAGSGGPSHWFAAAFAGASGPTESRLCLQCHDLGKSGLQPHGVDPGDLSEVTQAAISSDSSSRTPPVLALAALGPGPARGADGALACATCHREHRGRDADLEAMTNAQCQICHVRKFASFARGHPDFSRYPYVRRTRIRFNHATHRKDHYRQEGAEFDCRGCHQPDRQGQVMLISGFEQDCAACHAKDVAVEEGIAFLQLPGVDTDALAEAGVQIGQWPELANLDQEAELTPYLRIMLASDPANAAAFDALPGEPENLVFALLGEDPDEARAVGQLVWATKELLFDLSERGEPALKEHLDSGLRKTMGEEELASLSANFDFDLASEAAHSWFPDLATEIATQRRARAAGPDPGYALDLIETELVPTREAEASDPTWGWSLDAELMAIRYHPRGHADLLLKSWLDATIDPSEHANPAAVGYALASLARPAADGSCTKCHSVDVTDAIRTVNWSQKRRDLGKRGFTRYLHRPHLIQPGLRSCVACHSMGESEIAAASAPEPTAAPIDSDQPPAEDEPESTADAEDNVAADEVAIEGAAEGEDPSAADEAAERFTLTHSAKRYAQGYEDGNRDPQVYSSNFEPLARETCRSCHQSGRASDSCLNCHRYHVNSAVLMGAQSDIEAPDGPKDDES